MFRKTMQQVAAVAVVTMSLSLAGVSQTKTPPPEPKIKVGDTAPDFTLRDQNGKQVSLHDFKGKKNVALAFFVFAFTGG